MIYARVSTEEQKEERGSLVDQPTFCAITAHVQGTKYPCAIFWDDHTGKDYDRPGLRALMEYVRDNEVAGVAVWEMGRFGREETGGIQLVKELAEMGRPLHYHIPGMKNRFVVAEWEDPEERNRAWQFLWQAAQDLQEHKAKTQRGREGLLLDGCYPGNPSKNWIFHTWIDVEEHKKTLRKIVRRKDAQQRGRRILAALRHDPSWERVKSLSKSLNTRASTLVSEIHKGWVAGVFAYGEWRDDKISDHLVVYTPEEYEELCVLLEQAEQTKPQRKKKRTALEASVEAFSLEYIHILENGNVVPLCPGGAKGVDCGLPMWLREHMESTVGGRDLWICPDGHKATFPTPRARDALRRDCPPTCPECGRYEFTQWGVSHRFPDGGFRIPVHCTNCETSFLVNREVDPIHKVALRHRNRRLPEHERTLLENDPALKARPGGTRGTARKWRQWSARARG